MSLLPSEPDTSAVEENDPRVIGVDSDDADDVLSALTSETARNLLQELHRDPAPPAELADRVGTSLQNAQYHLQKLENAGAIEVIDTIYSEKGREMNVYAPSDRPLVIFAGREEQTTGLRAALSRLLGSLGILALASLAVQALYGRGILSLGGPGGGDGASESQSGGGGGDAAAPAPGAGENRSATTEADVELDRRAETTGADGGDGGYQVADATETATEAVGDGGGGATATPQATPTATPKPTAEATATPQPTGTPTPVPEATGTPQPTAEPTPLPTAEPAATGTPTEAPATVTEAVNTTVQATTDTAASAPDVVAATAGLPPGLVFFAGGATAILVVSAVWYLTQ